jgi:mannose-6-phosphate isomerase class I
VMPKKKSVQNQQLTDEEMMECFLAMEKIQKTINGRKTAIANLHIQFEHFAKHSQEQRRLMGEISELIRLNEKAKKTRFELFLKLIVRLRNQFTKKGTYTKRNFLVEVKRYLDTTDFTVR